jgi:hypothetical protein
MLWDDRNFYIGAELEEPHVWATLTRRDSVIFQDNDFEFFIDPDGDNHQYYEGEINPLNTFWDLRLVKPYRDGGPALNEWNIQGLRTAARVRGTLNDPRDKDAGWTVEMAIPWKALGEFTKMPAPPRPGDQWRINFSRVEWRHEIVDRNRDPRDQPYRKLPGLSEDNWVWSPQGVVDMHRPERWGYVQFSSLPPGKDPFRPDPSAAVRDRLHQVYYAQKAYYEQNQRWASDLGALGITDAGSGSAGDTVKLLLTGDGFSASAQYRGRDGALKTCRIRQDSRIECER